MQVMRVSWVMILQPEFLARHNNVGLDELVTFAAFGFGIAKLLFRDRRC